MNARAPKSNAAAESMSNYQLSANKHHGGKQIPEGAD